MNRVQKIQRAKSYLEMLSHSLDPLTGEEISDPILSKQEIKNMFTYVALILQEVIDNGGEVVKLDEPAEFKIEKLNKSAITISDKPIQLRGFIARINKAANNSKMKSLSIACITNWLIERGYLTSEKVQVVRNMSQYNITDSSIQIGITSEEKVDTKTGELKKNVVLTKAAQEFIIDNLEEILAKNPDNVDEFDEKDDVAAVIEESTELYAK